MLRSKLLRVKEPPTRMISREGGEQGAKVWILLTRPSTRSSASASPRVSESCLDDLVSVFRVLWPYSVGYQPRNRVGVPYGYRRVPCYPYDRNIGNNYFWHFAINRYCSDRLYVTYLCLLTSRELNHQTLINLRLQCLGLLVLQICNYNLSLQGHNLTKNNMMKKENEEKYCIFLAVNSMGVQVSICELSNPLLESLIWLFRKYLPG